MTYRTNLSWNTLARYNALMWNQDESFYCIGEDVFVGVFHDSGLSSISLSFLKGEVNWCLFSREDELESSFEAACHSDFLDGYRDSETVAGHKKYIQEKKRIQSFRRAYKKWLSSVETVEEWTLPIDMPEDLLSFRKDGKAKPILH